MTDWINDFISKMTPLQKARWQLTLWYMAILTGFIIVFTYLVLDAKTSSYVRVYNVIDSYAPGSPQVVEFADQFELFNQRFKQRLFLFDMGMLFAAALLSYFLSGKTLEPIRKMMREQSSFVTDVSHGLRTPLTTMHIEVESLLRTGKRVNKDVKKTLMSMQEEIVHMTNIVGGLLALVRSGKDPMKLDFVPVDLSEVVEKTVEQLESLAVEKRQQLKVLRNDQVEVMGNSDQLRQVAVVLLDNAIKYSGSGSCIDIQVEKHKSMAKLTVKDSGMGMSEEDLEKAFDRFYRGKHKDQPKGSGLGLAIAQKIVDHHDGSIRIVSNPGKGSTFVVTLPRTS